MEKLILVLSMVLICLSGQAQGVVTIETIKDEVPLEQWYVIRDKEHKNQEFYYAETALAKEELQKILLKDDQDIDFPKGTDSDGDPYWVILKENELLVYIYLSEDTDEYSMITILIK